MVLMYDRQGGPRHDPNRESFGESGCNNPGRIVQPDAAGGVARVTTELVAQVSPTSSRSAVSIPSPIPASTMRSSSLSIALTAAALVAAASCAKDTVVVQPGSNTTRTLLT